MKPVTQTITGPAGNCMGACLASILEVPIETVPNFFDAGPDDTDWWNALRAWLRKFGLGIITLTFESPAQWTNLRLAGYHIVSGPSPRLEGMHHATVWHRGRMVHDPHPDGTGIVKPETLDMLYLIEPASLQLPASVIAAQLRGQEPSALQTSDRAPLLVAHTRRYDMLQALEDLKTHAEAMKEKFAAGVAHIEEDFAGLLAKIESVIGLHKAATDEEQPAVHVIDNADPAVPGIEVTECAPAAGTTTADAAPASSDPAPAA